MTEGIIVALITGAVTLVGVLISNKTSQAVIEARVDELTREVRAHNTFAARMPVVENEIQTINRRVANLEQYHKGN